MASGTKLADAYVQIIPSAKGIQGKITEELGGEASSAGKSAGKSIVSSIKSALAAAGIGAALKATITEGANLQQSLGGVETLFKDSADQVIANARNAYKTAGMSANDYMETVTGFSASLLQGLAGDTNLAASIADIALTDMSDNANKMGTDMELIKNAYQGFAKQNYTMLDNLKLGYSGTKTEMERLLADAKKLSGVEYNIDNLSDVYSAIHVIQEEMGITGTTADEAASTFSGSLVSMKAALDNLLGNLSLGEDIGPSLQALLETAGTFLFDNLVPMAINIVSGLVNAIINTDWLGVAQGIITKLGEGIALAAEQILGVDGGPVLSVFTQLSSGLEESFRAMWEVLSVYWTEIGQPIFESIQRLIGIVRDAFAERMPAIQEFVGSCFSDISVFWEENLKPCFSAIGAFIENVLAPLFEKVFAGIIGPLIDEVFGFIKRVWENSLKPAFVGITDFLTGVFTGDWKKALEGILNIVTSIFNGIRAAIEAPMDMAKNIVKNAINAICEFFDFEWRFPELKLPHFSISGEFSLNPLSVPSFGIDWYDKAMNTPIIMTRPTAFGINSLGQIMAGGESGSEVVSGTETLLRLISQAVASQNSALITVLLQILEVLADMDENMGSRIKEALAGIGIEWNKRELARLKRAVI